MHRWPAATTQVSLMLICKICREHVHLEMFGNGRQKEQLSQLSALEARYGVPVGLNMKIS